MRRNTMFLFFFTGRGGLRSPVVRFPMSKISKILKFLRYSEISTKIPQDMVLLPPPCPYKGHYGTIRHQSIIART